MKTIALALSATLLTLGALPAEASDNNHRRYEQRQRHERPERHERQDRHDRHDRHDWRNLGVVQTTGNDDTLVLDRWAGRIDDLRIEATRGTVNLRSVVLTTADGRRYVVPVHQRLRPGNAQLVDVPGPAQRIASVELQYAGQRGGFWRRAFWGNRADVVMFGR